MPTLLPLAADSERVDLETPTFSDPTKVDNPLFPISNLHSAVLLGNNERHPIRIETTLMQEPKVIEVDGQAIETLESQFVSYQDGRIHEVATDWYAQGDDGAVYYLGEDVFNYEDGVVADTDGTWVAGDDAPVAMIMPADPQPGDVFRPENIPGELMEEVTIKQVDVTVDGPYGPIDGAIIAQENHTLEGVYEDKWFAPGYGEFFSGVGDSLESLGIGIPTGALDGPAPSELITVHDEAVAVFDAAADGDWQAAAERSIERRLPGRRTSTTPRSPGCSASRWTVPSATSPGTEWSRRWTTATPRAPAARHSTWRWRASTCSFPTGRRRRPTAPASRSGPAGSSPTQSGSKRCPASLAGDVTTLDWVWPRFAHTVDSAPAGEIESLLAELRGAADEEDVATISELAPALLDAAQSLG